MARGNSLLIIDYGRDYWKYFGTIAKYHIIHRNTDDFFVGVNGSNTLRRLEPIHSEASATTIEAIQAIARTLWKHDSRYFDSEGGIYIFDVEENTIEQWIDEE